MAKLTITVDTIEGTLQANVDGENISNIYNIGIYSRKDSPYYNEEYDSEYPPVEVSLSMYEKNISSITSKTVTYAKEDITTTEGSHVMPPFSDELKDLI